MSHKTKDDRSVIVTDSIQLPEFSRELPYWSPVIVRAIRDSQYFENRVEMAIETPQTAEEKVFGEGLVGFLNNKKYLVMVLTHYEALFAKPYKNWSEENWHLVSHTEAQALLPFVQEGCLSERDIRPIWGDSFLKLSPQQRIARVVELLSTFLHQAFKIAITRGEIKELIKQNRSDTVAPLVSNTPSSKPPIAAVAEWEDQFRQYFSQVPAEYQKKEYELHYRFVFFQAVIVQAFQALISTQALTQESQEKVFAHIQKQTGIAYDVIRKSYFVFTQAPELVKNPNCPISHVLELERTLRIEQAKQQLASGDKSIADIKGITQGLTNVRGDNANIPGDMTQVLTKEGMVACIYADERRMVVRYPRLEFDMHKIYEKVRSFVEAQKASGKEVLSAVAFQRLGTLLTTQIDNVFNSYYTQIAYNESGPVLAELKKMAEERVNFHAQHVTKVLAMADGLKSVVQNGFDSNIFKSVEKLFAHDNTEWNESMSWLSSPAIVAGDMSDERFALLESQVDQLVEAKNQLARLRMAKSYFYHLKRNLRTYVSNLFPTEHMYAQTAIDALSQLEEKWRLFNDCYDALSKTSQEDQAPKQEFLLWISILSDTLAEMQKQLGQASQNVGQQVAVLEAIMCRGQVTDSVWGWAQKQYETKAGGQSKRLHSAAFVPLVRRLSLDEDTMKMVWQEWQKNMLKVILSNQVPTDKEAGFELVLSNMGAFEHDVGRFPKVYPEFWYINPEQYLGANNESRVPLADALLITVSTENGSLEQWQLLYTLGTLKLRKIANIPGGRGSRAQTMFTSEGH